jgi:biopolymer transport protein ExbB/TolQ
MVDILALKFQQGGPFMYVILAVLACAVAVVIERLIFYFVFCAQDARKLVADIAKALNEENVSQARERALHKKAPLNVILGTALQEYAAGARHDDIRESVEETAIREVPRLSQRLNYLALFANIATLIGLLGTIHGLQISFSSLAAVEAAKKATMLARGISQAMNTTAFGLIVAVPCMVFYTLLANTRDRLTKQLDEAVVRLLNYIKKRRA